MEGNEATTPLQRLMAQNESLRLRVAELEGRREAKRREPLPPDGLISKRAAARQREAAANAEISRLKSELATLRAEGCPGYLALERKREEGSPILPKRALTLAGYWNVLSNDILAITPLLIAAVEAKGGSVLRREGKHLCFHSKDRRLVMEAVVDIMPRMFPQYRRRRD
jgi:hypothetical protein